MNRINKSNITGKEGESEAQRFLERKGYRILHKNWRWHHYELDIVAATPDGLIVFVEVKTRGKDCLLSPEESVDNAKIRRIVMAADAYIRKYNISVPARFDIVSLTGVPGEFDITHIEDAFLAPVH